MFVTRHQGITDARLRDQLWSLYAVATHGADRTSAVRRTVDHLDFDAQLAVAMAVIAAPTIVIASTCGHTTSRCMSDRQRGIT